MSKPPQSIKMQLIAICLCGGRVYATFADAEKPAVGHETPECRDFATREAGAFITWLKNRKMPHAEA